MRFSIPLTLRLKIILLTGLMTLIAAGSLGVYAYRQTLNATVDTATESLGWETKLIALKFQSSFAEIASDAVISANTPPISGLFRTLSSDVDPIDGSTREHWVARLERIFESIMTLRQHYTQMRFIGLDNNGREIVRIDRKDGEIVATRGDDLQFKSGEFYFKQGAALAPGEVFVSEVTYNREFGQIEEAAVPTLRVVVPVGYDDEPLGMIVINVDYFALLDSVARTLAPQKLLSIGNHDGDFYTYDPVANEADFIFHQDISAISPEFVRFAQQTNLVQKVIEDEANISYYSRVLIDKKNENSYLGVFLTVPKSILLAKARHQTQSALFLISVLVLSCVVATIFASRFLTEPLINMTRRIQETPVGALPTSLPTLHSGEIGDLARSFSELAQRLISRESDARTLVDTVVDGILSFDKDGKILEFNPACERMFGYETSEVIGTTIEGLFSDTSLQVFVDMAQSGDRLTEARSASDAADRQARRKDGTTFFSEISCSRSAHLGRLVYIAVLRDVTARKKLQVLQDEFVSTVNHELRTPLTSIIGALGLLKAMTAAKLDARASRLLELSYDNSKRLGTLVDDILDMEKIAAGKMSYRMEIYEISELVTDIVNRHQSYSQIYDVTFVINTAPEQAYCRVDASRFNQALVNLLSNAAKFSPAGAEVVFTVGLDTPEWVRISVLDHGPGLPSDFIPKVFEKFAQADSSSTRSKGGSGLGLSITKAIIEAFGGEISFETVLDKGTTFTIELPRHPKPDPQDIAHDT